MTLTSVAVDSMAVDVEQWAEIDASPSVDDWLRVMWGLRPGVSSPRCTAGPGHSSWAAGAGWLRAMWGIGV